MLGRPSSCSRNDFWPPPRPARRARTSRVPSFAPNSATATVSPVDAASTSSDVSRMTRGRSSRLAASSASSCQPPPRMTTPSRLLWIAWDCSSCEACRLMMTSVASCMSRVQRRPCGTSTMGNLRLSASSMMSAGMLSTNRVVLTKSAAASAIMTRLQNSRCRSRSPFTANIVERTISPPDSQSAMSGTSPTVTEVTRRSSPAEPASSRASLSTASSSICPTVTGMVHRRIASLYKCPVV